ncbi:hypothetical protein [Rhodoferax antarcticus]|uniref:Uncharacterized protein n=1 Tax=Rhodoferax antarcticus ANT.BR TaxID=1111071 RepID=A0A1Q8Y8Y4_9BURK|nr:hypothetical protein [Rhodoferax antarcticus]OLP04512.1 hypothetical protein BLL52_4297 [Rhodoferax antarcticus ANT.BR]
MNREELRGVIKHGALNDRDSLRSVYSDTEDSDEIAKIDKAIARTKAFKDIAFSAAILYSACIGTHGVL